VRVWAATTRPGWPGSKPGRMRPIQRRKPPSSRLGTTFGCSWPAAGPDLVAGACRWVCAPGAAWSSSPTPTAAVKPRPGHVLDASATRHPHPPSARTGAAHLPIRVSEGQPDPAALALTKWRSLHRWGPVRTCAGLQFRPLGGLRHAPAARQRRGQDGFAGRPFSRAAEREIAILFADIRGFTKLSKHKFPYDIVFHAQPLLRGMGRGGGAGGRVDKFMGDGVNGLFG